MKTYRSPKTEIKESLKGGKGLFARKPILKDEIIAIKNGPIVDQAEATKLDRELGDWSLQIAEEFYICPRTLEEVEDVVIYINHSCNPNVGMDGQINYVAMRDIGAGEELCMDYAMAIAGNYSLDCQCGSTNCRGVVTGEDWKKEDLQKRYGSYFSWFIFKRFSRKDR